jgi:hypothetical protein
MRKSNLEEYERTVYKTHYNKLKKIIREKIDAINNN